jgi:hypothetical protein
MRFPSFYLNAPPWTHLGCPSTDPKAKAVTWTTFNPPVNVVKILRGGAIQIVSNYLSE